MSPILTPERYAEAYMRKKQLQSEVQRLIRSAGVKSSTNEVDETITKHITQHFLVDIFIFLFSSFFSSLLITVINLGVDC